MEFSFPEHYYNRLELLLPKFGFSFDRSPQLAKAILELSDHYIQEGGVTPWDNPATSAAYIAYFFPLNYIRARSALLEASRVGFMKNFDSFVDFGSGPGTFPCAFRESENGSFPGICIERNKNAPNLYEAISGDNSANLKWHHELKLSSILQPEKKLLLLSYALLEIGALPEGWDSFDNIMIVEPSDRNNGRKLLATRDTLIKSGFYIWAPCTHNKECPLLGTKTDWCHHRVFWRQPKWFNDLEKHLPIKNKTLTYSFLIASRKPPPPKLSQLARLTGDQQDEKGKYRQMVCRSSEREFLAWLKRDGKAPELKRGELIKIAQGAAKVSNEIRLGPDDISVLAGNLFDS